MKKLLIIFAAFAVWFLAMAQLNYEQACGKAARMDTDGQILQVMQDHGYELDSPYMTVTPWDKVVALFNCLSR